MEELMKEILAEVKGVKFDVQEMKSDIEEMKVDITGLKSDVQEMKIDITGLKSDMQGMQVEISGMKSEIVTIQQTMATKTDVAILPMIQQAVMENAFSIIELKEGQSEQTKILRKQDRVLDLLKVKTFDTELLLRQVE